MMNKLSDYYKVGEWVEMEKESPEGPVPFRAKVLSVTDSQVRLQVEDGPILVLRMPN